VLAPGGVLMPNSVGNTGGLLAGLPRMARAALMRLGSTNVRFVNWKVGRENLNALATILQSGDARVVISEVHPLADAAKAVAHMLGHHAVGKIAITV
jgi:NADPH:quinone reductase-like Zn-dependent oxidoreductase